MRGRPEIPKSWVIDLDHIIDIAYVEGIYHPDGVPYASYDTDIIIPVWDVLPEDIVKNLIFLLDHKIYSSTKSRFIDFIQTTRSNSDRFYIYDKWKTNNYSHKKGYKQFTVEISHHDGGESIFIPVYWRIN